MELYMQNLGLAEKTTNRAQSPFGRQKAGAANADQIDKTRNTR